MVTNLIGRIKFWWMAYKWRKKVKAHLSQGIKIAVLPNGITSMYIPSEEGITDFNPDYQFHLPPEDNDGHSS